MNASARSPETPLFPFEQIAALRRERGESLAEFAAAIGCSSKGRMSEIERGRARPTVAQALRLEELSGGRIDAGALNADVRAARHGRKINPCAAPVHSHACPVPERDGSPSPPPDAAGERRVLCAVCERQLGNGLPDACRFVDCPHGEARAGAGDAA
jgi:transcriptional regulator with XRE-family HTH domain